MLGSLANIKSAELFNNFSLPLLLIFSIRRPTLRQNLAELVLPALRNAFLAPIWWVGRESNPGPSA